MKTRVIGYVPLVENMPSGHAIRPGDVLKIRNGKTVEVLNTDAEGRLILADALSLAADGGARRHRRPRDAHRRVHGCARRQGRGPDGQRRRLGRPGAGAADRAARRCGTLPLPAEYRKMLDSEVADLRNIGTGGYGGALTAGLFLKEFTGDVAVGAPRHRRARRAGRRTTPTSPRAAPATACGR